MKTFKLIYPVIVLMIVTVSTVYSQTDSATNYTKGISIYYSIGTMDKVNFELHNITQVPENRSIDVIRN